jgi:hypothetical protein
LVLPKARHYSVITQDSSAVLAELELCAVCRFR